LNKQTKIIKIKEIIKLKKTILEVKELNNTKNSDLKEQFEKLIKDLNVLPINTYIKELANEYINQKIFPQKYIDDAIHVACASYHNIAYLISWNFEHIVKVKTRRLVNLINALSGINELEIISPLEL
jgi:hypothetical protein